MSDKERLKQQQLERARQLNFIARNAIYGSDTERAVAVMKNIEKEFLQDLIMEQQEQM